MAAASTAAARTPAPEAPAGLPLLLERINPLRSVRRHRLVAASLLTVLVALGIPVAFWKGKPIYYSEAVVFVSPRFLKNLQDDKELEMQSNSQYREYVQQNVRTINRYDILERAVAASPQFREAFQKPKESERRLIERLQGALDIKPVPDTYQITVGLESDTTVGLAEFLNKLVSFYLAKAKEEEFYASDSRLASLAKEGDQLSKDIATKQEQRTQLAQQLGVSTFTENYINPYDRLLVSAKEALADARRKRIEAEASVNMLEGPGAADKRRSLEAFALDLATKDAAVTSTVASLNQRRADLLTRMSGLSEKHPGRLAAQKELNEIDAEKQKALDGLVKTYSATLVEQRRAETRRAREVEQALSREVDQQQSQAAFFTRNYQEGISMGLQIDRLRKRLESIEDRSRFLTQESRAPGFVRVFSDARTPEVPTKGGKTKIAVLFGVFGLLLAIAVPVAIDVLDPRVFSPADAVRVGGVPLLGWIPDRGAFGEAYWGERILRLAHRVYQDSESNGTRIWCVTGAQGKAGTTMLVRSLGKALTGLGSSVLTVEADPRATSGSRGGLTMLLNGRSSLADAIERDGESMPDRLPAGGGDGTGHLPDLHRLTHVLAEAARIYKVVLVDLPPVSTSVEAEYLTAHADAVVLLMRSGESGRILQRALKLLERNKPKAVALVLNGVPAEVSPGVERDFGEFRSGAARVEPRWKTPWLWK